MDRKISNIRLSTENCEIITIPANKLLFFMLKDVTITYGLRRHFIPESDYVGIKQYKECGYMLLRCNDVEYHPLDDEDETNTLSNKLNSISNITCVDIEYADGEIEPIYVPWGDDEYVNPYQRNSIKHNGNDITILITNNVTQLNEFEVKEREIESNEGTR